MGGRRDSWQETFRGLGQALIEMLRAEWALIAETWQRSGRELGKAAALMVVVGYLGLIWFPALVIFAMVTGLSSGLGWPLWGAALVVAAVVLLVAYGLARLAAHVMSRRFENPVATVQRSVADHRAWWSERIVGDETTEGESDGALDRSDRAPGEPPAGV